MILWSCRFLQNLHLKWIKSNYFKTFSFNKTMQNYDYLVCCMLSTLAASSWIRRRHSKYRIWTLYAGKCYLKYLMIISICIYLSESPLRYGFEASWGLIFHVLFSSKSLSRFVNNCIAVILVPKSGHQDEVRYSTTNSGPNDLIFCHNMLYKLFLKFFCNRFLKAGYTGLKFGFP